MCGRGGGPSVAPMLHRTSLRRVGAALITTLIAVGGPAAAAHAGTVSYDEDDLVYQAGPGERNSVSVFQSPDRGVGWVRLADSGGGVSAPADRCVDAGNGWTDCRAVGGVYVALGDGDDSFGFGVAERLANPVAVLGGAGSDTLRGNKHDASIAYLVGEDGDDVLEGGTGDELLQGGAGADALTGGAGADTLKGEDGDDRLDGDGYAAPGRDVIDGGAGRDVVAGWANPGADHHPAANVTLDGQANDGRPGEGDDVAGVEQIEHHVNGVIEFSDADDRIDVWSNLSGGASRLAGRGGDDFLRGGSNEETIDGGAGADRIEGGFGPDVLVGGPGPDTIHGDQTGENCGLFATCTVPFGNDTIDARDGERDTVACGPGEDRAVVDAVDVVDGCETVERAGAPAPAPAAAGPGAAGPGAPGSDPRAADARPVPAVGGGATRRGGRVTVSGRFALPRGVARSTCAGARVTVTLTTRAGRTLDRRTAAVDRRCAYRATLRTKGARGLLKASVRFAGTARLAPAPVRRVNVR